MVVQKTIDNAIQVIEYAIKNSITVKEASVKCGFSDTYVKNVKARIIKSFEDGEIDPDVYTSFMDLYSTYLGKPTDIAEEEFGKLVDKTTQLAGEQLKQEEKDDEMTIEWRGIDNDDDSDKGEEDSDKGDEDGSNKEDYEKYKKEEPHVKTLGGLLNACNVDTNIWKVKNYIVNKWDVTSWQSGFAERRQNWQVKAFLEKKVAEHQFNVSLDAFKNIVKKYRPLPTTKYVKSKINFNNENNLLELGLYDLHIGKLAWAGETGENFDVKIAMKRFMSILNTLLKRAEGFSYNRILFPIGNDFFNSDTILNTTTAGTPQDEDLRWQKTFSMGVKLLISAIDMLKDNGVPIDVVVISGNHDKERSYYLGSVLEAWFNEDTQVNIDNGASPRKYYEFGEVLIGLSHGNEEKENSLPLLMATEQKEAWGRTKFHEFHLGHFHRKRNVKFTIFDRAQVLNEDLGVTVRYLSSLSGTDAWHNTKGFVGSQKAGEVFIWNDKTGMIGHLNANFVDFDREH